MNSCEKLHLQKLDAIKKKISNDAVNPRYHFEIARLYADQKKWTPAIASYRTGLMLSESFSLQELFELSLCYLHIGQNDLAVSSCNYILDHCQNSGIFLKAKEVISQATIQKCVPLTSINHNIFCRLKTISDYLLTLFPDRFFSILDVGGGQGQLCQFLPDSSYAIADPVINGISGMNLPFPDKMFDVVVVSHVLEHVSANNREDFLFQLCCKSKKKVVLLNSFINPKINDMDRLQLIVSLTNAHWAKEHVMFGLPSFLEIEKFAAKYNFDLVIKPHGSIPISLAMVLLDYYALKSRSNKELQLIHTFFNTKLINYLDNNDLPTDYIVEINLR